MKSPLKQKSKKSFTGSKQVDPMEASGKIISEIPKSFEHLMERHKDFQKAAVYFENEYTTAVRQNTRDPSDVVLEAKHFLTQGLVGLAEDFHAVSSQLDQLLTAQEISVQSLGSYADLVSYKVSSIRDQQLIVHLDELCHPIDKEIFHPQPSTRDVPLESVLPSELT